MKRLKYFLIALLMFSFVLISCKKTITESEEVSIVGNWVLSSTVGNWILTTNTDQVAKIPFSGNGEIIVTGANNSVLRGLLIYDTDPFSLAIVEIVSERYVLTLMIIDDDSNTATIYVGDTEQTFVGNIHYTYDGVTLIIENSELSDPNDANETVTVSGTISFHTISIPTNTPTAIEISQVWAPYEPGSINAEFLDDGTFSMSYNLGNTTTFQNGTWETSDGTLTIVIIDDNEYITDVNNYSINGNVLSIQDLIDECSDNIDPSACLNNHEDRLGLENGSLTRVQTETFLYFRKANAIN